MTPDLSKLTKAQKLELLDLLEKRRTVALQKKDTYVPNEGQARVHATDILRRFVFSGNGSGKSTLGVHEAHWAVTGYNPLLKRYTPVPARCYVVLDKPEKVNEIFIAEWKKWFPLSEDQCHKHGKTYISEITFANGSFIKFLFHEQSPLTAEGIEGDFFWFDEPPPRALYIALARGGRTKGKQPKYLMTGTPISAPWLRTEIKEKWETGELADTECFQYGTEVNVQNLREGWMEEFSALLTEREKETRLRGGFFDIEGLAFSGIFSRKLHTVKMPVWRREWPTVVAIDPHLAKPHHAILLGVTDQGQRYVLKELKMKGLPQDFARALQLFMKDYRVIDIVCDSFGNSEMSGGEGFLSFIQVLRKNGIMVRSTTYEEKDDEAWVDRIRSALALPAAPDQFGQQIPNLLVVDSCVGSIRDFENAQWVKVRNEDTFKPKLDISNKDFLACIKYALSTNLTVDKAKKPWYPNHSATSYGQRPTNLQLFRKKNGIR